MAFWITRVIEDAFEVYLWLLGAVALLKNCSNGEKKKSHVEVKCRGSVMSSCACLVEQLRTIQSEQSEIFTSEAAAAFYRRQI